MFKYYSNVELSFVYLNLRSRSHPYCSMWDKEYARDFQFVTNDIVEMWSWSLKLGENQQQ